MSNEVNFPNLQFYANNGNAHLIPRFSKFSKLTKSKKLPKVTKLPKLSKGNKKAGRVSQALPVQIYTSNLGNYLEITTG
jgi:hypothetical protein